MSEKGLKISRFVSECWLFVCGAVLVCFSLYSDHLRPVYTGKVPGIFGTFAILVLAVIGAVSGEISCLGITPEREGKRYAIRLLWTFLAGLILQLLYAGYSISSGRSSILKDSMVTAGIFCLTVQIYMRMKRQ